jgi:hypothetical protein
VTERELAPSAAERALLEEILRSLRSLRFGSLELTIHDGRVVQIERREKLRPRPGSDQEGQARP